MQIRVAGAQIPVTRDVERNVRAIGRAIAYAAVEKADVLLTPEGSLSGYTPAFDRQAVEEGLRRVTGWAREAGVEQSVSGSIAAAWQGKGLERAR